MQVFFKTKDDKKIVVPDGLIKSSETLLDLVSFCDENDNETYFDLKGFGSDVVSKFVQFSCKKINSEKITQRERLEFVQIANLLNTQDILTTLCSEIAKSVGGRSPEEMLQMFSLIEPEIPNSSSLY